MNAWKTTWKLQVLKLGKFSSIGTEIWRKLGFSSLGTWDLEVFRFANFANLGTET